MTLLQAWADSVSLLKPNNLKLFLLVTLKSIIETYKVLFNYWWWLYLIVIGYWVVSMVSDIHIPGLIVALTTYVALSATILSTRPSLFQKDATYFKEGMVGLAMNLGAMLVLVVIIMNIMPFTLPFLPWMSVLWPLQMLFFLDSNRTLFPDVGMSLVKALTMLVYNLPLWIIVVGVMVVSDMVLAMCFSFVMVPMNIVSEFLLPFSICLITNIYIKKLHDQFDLYCKQPK